MFFQALASRPFLKPAVRIPWYWYYNKSTIEIILPQRCCGEEVEFFHCSRALNKLININILCLKKATNRPERGRGQTSVLLMYALPGGRETGTVRQGRNVCTSPCCWPLSTPPHRRLAKPTIPRRCVSNQWERAKRGRKKEASPLLVHPLTSICAITPFDTWFHVTRWPTGWTTKTRNRGSRYKWPPSGRSFHSVGGGGRQREVQWGYIFVPTHHVEALQQRYPHMGKWCAELSAW